MPEHPKRKDNRLYGYDYSYAGLYFVTICTGHRRNILADIVGAIHESPEVALKPAGRIVQQIIETLPLRFHIEIDKYVIMPNHIHMILWFTEDTERAIRESPLHRSLLSQVVGYLKMNASRKSAKSAALIKFGSVPTMITSFVETKITPISGIISTAILPNGWMTFIMNSSSTETPVHSLWTGVSFSLDKLRLVVINLNYRTGLQLPTYI